MKPHLRKKVIQERNNFIYLKIFIIVVFFIFAISLSIRIFHALSESKFQMGNYNVFLSEDDTAYVIGFNKEEGLISVLHLTHAGNELAVKTREQIGSYLEIPIDSRIVVKSGAFSDINHFFSIQRIYSMILNSYSYAFENLNTIDVLKMYIMMQNASGSRYTEKTVDLKSYSTEDEEIRKDLFELFKDKSIINEKVSIEIVNVSGIDGVGTKISKILKNAGFNVISVVSGDVQSQSAIVVGSGSTYSINRLRRLLNISYFMKKENSIADVTVTIGREYAVKNINF